MKRNNIQEYKSITNLRLLHITSSQPNPSHFAILVRGIPWSPDQSYCETVKKFFSFYHPTTYLSHQIVYKSGAVQKLKVCLFLNFFLFLLCLQNISGVLWECHFSSEGQVW